jgi:hypothetical protein
VAKIKTAKNNKILFFVARKTMENKNMSYFRPKNMSYFCQTVFLAETVKNRLNFCGIFSAAVENSLLSLKISYSWQFSPYFWPSKIAHYH